PNRSQSVSGQEQDHTSSAQASAVAADERLAGTDWTGAADFGEPPSQSSWRPMSAVVGKLSPLGSTAVRQPTALPDPLPPGHSRRGVFQCGGPPSASAR